MQGARFDEVNVKCTHLERRYDKCVQARESEDQNFGVYDLKIWRRRKLKKKSVDRLCQPVELQTFTKTLGLRLQGITGCDKKSSTNKPTNKQSNK